MENHDTAQWKLYAKMLQCCKNYLNFICLPVVGVVVNSSVVGSSVVGSEKNCNEILSLQGTG